MLESTTSRRCGPWEAAARRSRSRCSSARRRCSPTCAARGPSAPGSPRRRPRRRDLILRGGENVYPVEIEHRLQEHPDVAEAAVVGVDHPELGQDIRAIVVARPGADLDVEDLHTFCAESLAYYKVPSHWEVRS